MKKLLLLAVAILLVIIMKAQRCPGSGVDFAAKKSFTLYNLK
jgi:hypothetical protein